MSALGLGRVKTPERATRVEAHRQNCASRESNHTAHRRLEVALENCIFYIFPMYEFSHSQGHSRPTHSAPGPPNVRYAPNTDYSSHDSKLTRSAISGRWP